jgi:MscS family membrane protein
MTVKVRLRHFFFLPLLILVLAACVPAPANPTIEPPSDTPKATTYDQSNIISATPTPQGENLNADATSTAGEGNEILVAPTLAPTATPGVISDVVENLVEATNLYETRILGLLVADWINLAISFLLVVLTVTLIGRLIFLILYSIAKRTGTKYDELYLRSIKPYFSWLLVVIVLNIATIRLQFLSPAFKQWLSQIYYIVIVGLVIIGLWKLIDIFTLWYKEKVKDQDERGGKEAVVVLAERGIRTLLVLVGLIIILDHIGFNISALVTAIGIGGLAISLAAQDTIANMISGVIILIDQPFRVGDRIEIQELNTWGDVVTIGLRSTRIRTLDNRLVIVPNRGISNNQVVNYTYPDPRYRIQTVIGVAYGSDLRVVRDVIIRSLIGVEGVLPDKPVDVLFMEWGDAAMQLRVRWWIESYVDARRSTDRVNEAIYEALTKAGIETPLPAMTVELRNADNNNSATLHGRRRKDE